MSCVKIKDPGDTDFRIGDIVPHDHFDQENLRVEAAGERKAEWIRPKPAAASTQLLGITKAAVQSDSFISAASFQETTKVLTEAALAGKVDYLVGLKENVILGHLVPAGTGFKTHLTPRFASGPRRSKHWPTKARPTPVIATRRPPRRARAEAGLGTAGSTACTLPPHPKPRPQGEFRQRRGQPCREGCHREASSFRKMPSDHPSKTMSTAPSCCASVCAVPNWAIHGELG